MKPPVAGYRDDPKGHKEARAGPWGSRAAWGGPARPGA